MTDVWSSLGRVRRDGQVGVHQERHRDGPAGRVERERRRPAGTPIAVHDASAMTCQPGRFLGTPLWPVSVDELVLGFDRPQCARDVPPMSTRRPGEVRLRVDHEACNPAGRLGVRVVQEVAGPHLTVDRLHRQAHLVDVLRSDIFVRPSPSGSWSGSTGRPPSRSTGSPSPRRAPPVSSRVSVASRRRSRSMARHHHHPAAGGCP